MADRLQDAATFWEEEGRALLAEGAGYVASEWSAPGHSPHPIVVLEGKRGASPVGPR